MSGLEKYMNLWGEDPSHMDNKAGIVVNSFDLTDLTLAGFGIIGHSEVHDYYQRYVVDTNQTF